MAEINFNNLYNQLSPMDRRFYDQQFQKSYNPNKENLRLSGQENYDQMKAVYDAQQQVPEKSFLDKIPFFGSASAAEMPQVPNLTYRNIDLPFDLGTGITNTEAASPFKIGISEMLNKYNVPNSQSQDLVNQLIIENQMKANQFDPTNFRSIFPTNVQTGIRQQVPLQNLGIDTSYGVANEPDEEQVEYLTEQEPSGIAKLFEFLGKLPTPFNLVKRGLESLRGLNNRIQNSDFGRSKTLMDYLDAKKYGGRDARDRAASQTMREARAIQQQVDRRGDSTSRVADRNRSSVTKSSAAKSKGVGGGGYTKSDSTRESYRGRY